MGGREGKTVARRGVVWGAILLALALYCGIDPFKQGPMVEFPGFETYTVDLLPPKDLPQDRDYEDRLQKAEIRFMGQVQGPESIAFDPKGRGPYTGVADGRIIFWDGRNWSTFAYTSPNRSEVCAWKPSILGYLKHEHICGRPLGLRFHRTTGELYIADAYLGLLKVGPEGGLATPLATQAEGVPFKFTNDLDVDSRGNVYFTDTSTNFHRSMRARQAFSAAGDDLGADGEAAQVRPQHRGGHRARPEPAVPQRCLSQQGRVLRRLLRGLPRQAEQILAPGGEGGEEGDNHLSPGDPRQREDERGGRLLGGHPREAIPVRVHPGAASAAEEVDNEAAHPGKVPLSAEHRGEAPRHGRQDQPRRGGAASARGPDGEGGQADQRGGGEGRQALARLRPRVLHRRLRSQLLPLARPLHGHL